MGSKPGRKTIKDYIHQAQCIVRSGKPSTGYDYALYADTSALVLLYTCKGSKTLYAALKTDFTATGLNHWLRVRS